MQSTLTMSFIVFKHTKIVSSSDLKTAKSIEFTIREVSLVCIVIKA